MKKVLFMKNSVKSIFLSFVILFGVQCTWAQCYTSCSQNYSFTFQQFQTFGIFTPQIPSVPEVSYLHWEIFSNGQNGTLCAEYEGSNLDIIQHDFGCFHGIFRVKVTIHFLDGTCCFMTQIITIHPAGTNILPCTRVWSPLLTPRPRVIIADGDEAFCNGVVSGKSYYVNPIKYDCGIYTYNYDITYTDPCGVVHNNVPLTQAWDVPCFYQIQFSTCVTIRATSVNNCCMPANLVRFYSFCANNSFGHDIISCFSPPTSPVYELAALTINCPECPVINNLTSNPNNNEDKILNTDNLISIMIDDKVYFVESSVNNSEYEYGIYTTSGELIESGISENRHLELNQKYTPGIYFVKIIQGKNIVTSKILKY